MKETRFSKPGLLVLALFTLGALGVLIGLGLWQLERKSWKENLVATMEARRRAEPIRIARQADWKNLFSDRDDFRSLEAKGRFQQDREIQVHGLMSESQGARLGFYVFTPLRLEDGSFLLVNRGFVPTEKRAARTRLEGQPIGDVTVKGVLRASEEKSVFLPANDGARGEFYVRNVADLAAAQGLSSTAPFYLQTDETPNPGGWPKGFLPSVDLPNNHLQYALTWFGIAAALIGIFGVFVYGRVTKAE